MITTVKDVVKFPVHTKFNFDISDICREVQGVRTRGLQEEKPVNNGTVAIRDVQTTRDYKVCDIYL